MSETTNNAAPLTVALIHGAFADASSWSGIIERLQASGFQVTAPAIPLRGIAYDLDLHCQLPQANSGAGACSRTLVRWCGDLERRG